MYNWRVINSKLKRRTEGGDFGGEQKIHVKFMFPPSDFGKLHRPLNKLRNKCEIFDHWALPLFGRGENFVWPTDVG